MAGAEGDGLPEAACGALVAARAERQGASGECRRDADSRLIILNPGVERYTNSMSPKYEPAPEPLHISET